jgi:hypothetical protein
MNAAVLVLCEKFQITTLQFTLQLKQNAKLPAFKGSMLHGWFGHALKQNSASLFDIFFKEHQANQPKPYAMHTCPDRKTHWQAGELMHFRLSLFGEATSVASPVIAALREGVPLGLGEHKAAFSLLQISCVTPMGLQSQIQAFSLAQWLPDNLDITTNAVAVITETPLRIKHQKTVLKELTFDLNFWISKILQRWLQLSKFWVVDDTHLFREVKASVPKLSAHHVHNQSTFIEWHRHSLSQKTKMAIGGLEGQWHFVGDIAQAWPLLKIGEILGLGSNTTFGLGRFQVMC